MRPQSLFDSLGPIERHHDWRPEAPPCLDGIRDIQLNFETTGLRWWDGDLPIAASICLPDGTTQYIPWGHRGGGNLDEATCKRWAQTELRGKRITNLNTGFDVHMGRVWGVDLEEQGNEVSDVGHYAALLDDHRQQMSLDSIIVDYLHEPPMARLDESRMADYHAGEAAARSQYNAHSVHRLIDLMWPLLDAQDLQRVRALEDQVIYVVCEMEKNGAPIDMELLERWIKESGQKLDDYLMRIAKAIGFQVNPDSPKDMERVFQKLNIPIVPTITGRSSFTDQILKRIDHPIVKDIRYAGKLISLRSKYLARDQKVISSGGILRYSLHQLRATTDEWADAGEAGTHTGRFSSTKAHTAPDEGVNIQQRMKVAKQRVAWGFDEDDDSHDDEIYPIRQLHIPRSGKWLSADAMQIEYRLFANYAPNPRVIQAYRENPRLSFHKFVWELIKPFKPDQTYRQQKDLNFAKVYGAGLTKLALMLEFITADEFQQLKAQKATRQHPKLAQALEVDRIYNKLLPEVGPLLRQATDLAKNRGYVCTLLGRRSRFEKKVALDGHEYVDRGHKAFNMVDQGGAADIMKTKLVELHKARKDTNFLMRFTVHDEVDGDAQEPDTAEKVAAILDHQSFPELKIPILWEVSTGINWKECA